MLIRLFWIPADTRWIFHNLKAERQKVWGPHLERTGVFAPPPPPPTTAWQTRNVPSARSAQIRCSSIVHASEANRMWPTRARTHAVELVPPQECRRRDRCAMFMYTYALFRTLLLSSLINNTHYYSYFYLLFYFYFVSYARFSRRMRVAACGRNVTAANTGALHFVYNIMYSSSVPPSRRWCWTLTSYLYCFFLLPFFFYFVALRRTHYAICLRSRRDIQPETDWPRVQRTPRAAARDKMSRRRRRIYVYNNDLEDENK